MSSPRWSARTCSPGARGAGTPNLAVYARRAQPFASDEVSRADDVRVRVASWDAGITLRVTPVMIQYSYYRQAEGRADFPAGIEGSLQARAWHVILVGVDVPLDGIGEIMSRRF
jgi:hypothetical protein